MGVLEQIAEIQKEMDRTQKNKATEHHLGRLKAKLAKLQSQLIEDAAKAAGGGGTGFDVAKQGAARVALVGFPSVGKSTLLTSLTTATSAVASYEFTTLTCVPGITEIHNAPIQILDLPGIVVGAAAGIGRGRQVISTARTADCILMMLDACKADSEKLALTRELECMGIRLNTQRPDIEIRRRDRGALKVASTVPLTKLDEDIIRATLVEYKIHNADVILRCDATVDELIDAIEGNRVYIPCLYVVNKIDMVSIPAVEHYASQPHTVVVSVHDGLNMDYLRQKLWEYLNIIRVYTKTRGEPPPLEPNEAIFLRRGSTVANVCLHVHKDLLLKFAYALVWGRSVLHCPQRVGKEHMLEDEDVVQIVLKK